MEQEDSLPFEDELGLMPTLRAALENGTCKALIRSENNGSISVTSRHKNKLKELQKDFKKYSEFNSNTKVFPTSDTEFETNAVSSDVSELESINGNITPTNSSSSSSQPCSPSSSINSGCEEFSDYVESKHIENQLSVDNDNRLVLSAKEKGLGKCHLYNEEKQINQMDNMVRPKKKMEKEKYYDIRIANVEKLNKKNCGKDMGENKLDTLLQSEPLPLLKNKSIKRKREEGDENSETVNAVLKKKSCLRKLNGKTIKLDNSDKLCQNDSPYCSVETSDNKVKSERSEIATTPILLPNSRPCNINNIQDLSKVNTKEKSKLKSKINIDQHENLLDQVATAFAKQLSGLNLGQLTPYQAKQLNMVLEKQNISRKLNTINSPSNKNNSDLFLAANNPIESAPASSPPCATPNRLSVDTDDMLPIQAEVVMSDGSENGSLEENETDSEDLKTKTEIENYLKSFIDFSCRGSIIEYPPLNNEVPKDGCDLTTWQLEKVSLPPFTPFVSPPPWLRFTIPAEGYKCNPCGDTFFIESSLVQHRERRSVWISLECGPCDAKLTFYNKCAFKAHIMQHSDRGEHVDKESVVIQMLPLQLTKLLQPIIVPVPQSLRPARAHSKTSSAKSSKRSLNFSSGNSVKAGQPKKEMPPDDALTTMNEPTKMEPRNVGLSPKRNVRCYLCERLFFSVRELMSHMRTNQSFSDQRVECRKCLLVLPSVCAAKAHILTHPPANSSNISVCPECGSRCDGPRDFVHHLNTCGHQYRRSGILCGQCQVCFFKFSEDFINHWIKEHCSKSYECVVCSNTFESLVFHKCSSPGQQVFATFKCLLTCPLCTYVVQLHTQEDKETQDKIRLHLTESHPSVINRIHYVYKSKFCTNAFRSKDELRAHHDREHRRDNHYRTKTCTLHHEVLGYQHQYFNGQEPRNAFITMPVALSPEEMEEAQTRDVPTVSSVIDKTLFPDIPMTLETLKGLKAEKERVAREAKDAEASSREAPPPPKKDSEALENLRPYVCYRCGYTYTGAKDFRRHRRSCEGETAVRLCQVCGVSAVGEEFAKHCLTHIRDGVVVCIFCNGTPFPSHQILHQHFELHVHEQFSYPVQCAFCPISMADVTMALSHMHEEHDPQATAPSFESLEVECDRCGRKFHGERGLNVHLTRCTVGTATPMPTPAAGRQCHVCKKALTPEIFGKHIISHLEEGLLVCSLCDGLTLPSSMALLHHLEEHASTMQFPSMCPMCSFRMCSAPEALNHLKEDHGFGNLSCTNCEMHFTFTYQLQRHIDIVHRVCLYAKRRYICWICRAYDHVKKETLMNHFRMVHGLSTNEVDEKVMIRTRGQGTMPTSQFIPTKPLGSKELGGTGKGEVKSDIDSPKKGLRSPEPQTNKIKETTESKLRVTPEDTKSQADEPQMNILLENLVIKKELLDVISKLSDSESYQPVNPAPNPDLYTTFKKGPLPEPKTRPEVFDDVESKTEPEIDKKAIRKAKRKKVLSRNRDHKLRKKTKVMVRRLNESAVKLPTLEKANQVESKEENLREKTTPPEVVKKKKVFTCRLCSYNTKSRVKIEAHKAKHKATSEEEGFLCSECGQSFVVEPSLKRHLFFAHKIKQKPQTGYKLVDPPADNRKALRKRKTKFKSSVTTLSAQLPRRITIKIKNPKPENVETIEGKISELQCCVCREEFDTSVKLYSHLRTHGMAFLKMGRKKRGFVQDKASISAI